MAGLCCCQSKGDEEEEGMTVAGEQQLATNHHQQNGNGSSDSSTTGSFYSADDDAAVSSTLLYQLDYLALVPVKEHLSSMEGVRFEPLNGSFARIPIKRRYCLQVMEPRPGNIMLIVRSKNGARIAVLRASLAGIRLLFTRLLQRFRRFRSIGVWSMTGQFDLALTMRHLLAAAQETGVSDVRRFQLKFNQEYRHDSVDYFLPVWLDQISPFVRHLQINHAFITIPVEVDFVQYDPAVAEAIGRCHHLRSVDLLGLRSVEWISVDSQLVQCGGLITTTTSTSYVGAGAALLTAIGSLPRLHTLRMISQEMWERCDDDRALFFPRPPPPPPSRTLTLNGYWLRWACKSPALMHFVGRVTGLTLYLDRSTLYRNPPLMTSVESVVASLPPSSSAPRSVTVHCDNFDWRVLAPLMPRWLLMAGQHRAEITLVNWYMPNLAEFGALTAMIERANIFGLLPLPDYDPEQLGFRFYFGASVLLLKRDSLI